MDVLTKLNNMINPEVMGDMISAGVIKNIKFAPLADVDETLVGRPGSTITLPKWAYIGDAVDVAEGEAIPLELLNSTSTEVTIKKAGKGLEITDEAVLSGYGDPVGEANSQLEKAITNKVDADSFTALDSVPVAMTVDLSASTKLNADAVADALVKFGEDLEGDKVLFIAPEQFASIRKDPDFIKVTELKETIMNGVVGAIWGCQLVLSARVKAVEGNYTNFIVKPGALGIVLKRETLVEKDRDIQRKTTPITADKHYAVYLKDESKAIKVIVQA